MLTPPTISQNADEAKRLLDADIYNAAQQGLEHENLAATGNLNVGFVIDYDAEAARRMDGTSLNSQQSYAGADGAFAPAARSTYADNGAAQANLHQQSNLPEQGYRPLDESPAGTTTAALAQTSTTESVANTYQASESQRSNLNSQQVLPNNTINNSSSVNTTTTNTVTNTTTNVTNNTYAGDTIINNDTIDQSVTVLPDEITNIVNNIVNNIFDNDTVTTVITNLLGNLPTNLIDIDLGILDGILGNGSNPLHDPNLLDLNGGLLGNGHSQASTDNDIADIDLGILGNSLSQAIEDNDVLDLDVALLGNTISQAVEDNDVADLGLAVLGNSLSQAVEDNDVADLGLAVLGNSHSQAIEDNDILDLDAGLLGSNTSTAVSDNDILDLNILSQSSAVSDNDVIDINLLSESTAASDNDLIGIDLGLLGHGTDDDIAGLNVDALGIDLTVNVTEVVAAVPDILRSLSDPATALNTVQETLQTTVDLADVVEAPDQIANSIGGVVDSLFDTLAGAVDNPAALPEPVANILPPIFSGGLGGGLGGLFGNA